jgi:hypothetical protein
MSEEVYYQNDGKKRMSPKEIIKALDDMKIEIEIQIFEAKYEDGEIKLKPSKWRTLLFQRRVIADMTPNINYIQDDLQTNAAVYARYAMVLAAIDRYIAKAKMEYEKLKSRVKIKIREEWSSPNIKEPTVDMVESLALCDKKVGILYDVWKDLEESKTVIYESCRALRMKHDSCLEISRMRRGEASIVGTTDGSIRERDEVPMADDLSERNG